MISYRALGYIVEDNIDVIVNKILIVFNAASDPKMFGEVMALIYDFFFGWKNVVDDEIDLILSKNTLRLKTMCCKRVFRWKDNTNGSKY